MTKFLPFATKAFNKDHESFRGWRVVCTHEYFEKEACPGIEFPHKEWEEWQQGVLPTPAQLEKYKQWQGEAWMLFPPEKAGTFRLKVFINDPKIATISALEKGNAVECETSPNATSIVSCNAGKRGFLGTLQFNFSADKDKSSQTDRLVTLRLKARKLRLEYRLPLTDIAHTSQWEDRDKWAAEKIYTGQNTVDWESEYDKDSKQYIIRSTREVSLRSPPKRLFTLRSDHLEVLLPYPDFGDGKIPGKIDTNKNTLIITEKQIRYREI